MVSSADRRAGGAEGSGSWGDTVIRVDRIACTGHGVCASLLPANFSLDEWGYPIVHNPTVDAESARTAIRLCPARAIFEDRSRTW